ncbi:methenyltetrahydromethanopterin cyclohydrolase [Aurantimonas sp. MSK8Z-1]|uniref:methenyltetrahydromethanopterin cyclohydrolase n=1 Tax=Mangrovibrevibacter kandeliae TaxID=2968473 RepID=UPI002117F078|nr:methenyltetrahydromethanopterin cyclohydrolase [Aurantimonas sp. MSK8Z-1]MCW4115587.1 methenyltetrahydromethanopterin cyclohydrolase [Aurantimonas sp. MSK8Z-1]
MSASHPSVNAGAAALVTALVERREALRVAVTTGAAGEHLIDLGAAVQGGTEAGRLLAEICMGGLGRVTIASDPTLARWPFSLTVATSQPVIACLASQYAGWHLGHGEGETSYFAMGSGPARALAAQEAIYKDLGYGDQSGEAVLVLETDRPPPPDLVRRIAEDCAVAPERLTILYAPTQSLAGTVQIVARVVEVALHKAHALEFPLERIVEGLGAAPLPPPHPDFVTAMGRTNDAVIYGGRVQLCVTGPSDDARHLTEQLSSRNSKDYGTPFGDIFRAYNGDFYKIDPMLFSPAEVMVVALETGECFRGGGIDPALVDKSFG